MKNIILYTLSALIATTILVLWMFFPNIIHPVNNIATLFLVLVIIAGYLPIIGEIFTKAYLPKQR